MNASALRIRRLTRDDAKEILTWRYPPPYHVYNLNPANAESDLRYFLDPVNNFRAIVDGTGALVGFCSFGADGQVPGGDYSDRAVDIGMGMRPDLTGRGEGATYARAVLQYCLRHYGCERARVTIAAFNRRARRVWESVGFWQVSEFEQAGSRRRFVIMVCKRGESSV